MYRLSFYVFLALLIPVSSSIVWSSSLWSRVEDRLSITGTKSYGLQLLSVSGNKTMFDDDNYGYSSRYRNETNLTVNGNVIKGLSLTATLSNNRWNPNERTMTLNYQNRKTKAALGDITATLTGNELIPFSKRLKGATVTQKIGNASVTAIASRTKAATRTVSVLGNNTPGPYYLGASQIVDGSERVKIDEREIPRSDTSGQSNYTFDAFSGILEFRDGLIVPNTSTITVSFETQGFNSNSGTIFGMRSELPITKKAGIGMTYLTQKTDQGSTTYSRITEPFRGNNTLSLPYELLYIPLEGSVSVKVDGILQTIPIDYTINYQLHYIVFTRPITSSSTILVEYVPKPENAVSGDRSVMGFDARMKVSDDLNIAGHFARSTSGYDGVGDGGNAASISASGKYKKLNYSVGLRDIQPGYAPLESVGFFRNERGGNVDLRYALTDNLDLFSKVEHYRRPNYQSSDPTTAKMVTSTESTNGFNWKGPKLPQLKVQRMTINSSDGADWKDNLSTDSMSVSWERNKVSTSIDFSRSNRNGSYFSDTTKSIVLTNNSSDTSTFSVKYRPLNQFSLSADIAGSRVKNTSSSTNAKNYQLAANFMPIKNVSVNASYRVADSGGNYDTAYSGYPGTGTNTNGTGQYPIGGYVPSYGLKSVTRMLGIYWNASSKLSLDTNYCFTYSEGENNTNTSIASMDFGFNYNPFEIVGLHGQISHQSGSFIGSSGDMSSDIGFINLNVGPIKKMRLDASYNKMLSGTQMYGLSPTDPLYQYADSRVDMQSYSTRLSRDIGHDRWLYTEYSKSSVTGISANDKSTMALGIDYPLNGVLRLNVDWRIIDYKDLRTSSNNYRGNMINAQIGARFN